MISLQRENNKDSNDDLNLTQMRWELIEMYLNERSIDESQGWGNYVDKMIGLWWGEDIINMDE